MARLFRFNSSVSSRTSIPPDIINEDDHIVEELISLIYINGIFLKLNLSPSIGLVRLKILFVLNTELELLNKL